MCKKNRFFEAPAWDYILNDIALHRLTFSNSFEYIFRESVIFDSFINSYQVYRHRRESRIRESEKIKNSRRSVTFIKNFVWLVAYVMLLTIYIVERNTDYTPLLLNVSSWSGVVEKLKKIYYNIRKGSIFLHTTLKKR